VILMMIMTHNMKANDRFELEEEEDNEEGKK
jgi:hypothetical protein